MIINKIDEISSPPLFYHIDDNLIGKDFFLKLEGLNIAGSIKIKPARHMIKKLIEEKKINLNKSKIIESSSGNLGIALSIVCKSLHLPFTCVVDPNINPQNIDLMRLYGADIVCVTEKDTNGGYLTTRIITIQQMLSRDPDLIWPNQYENPNNAQSHYITAHEIANQFKKLDYLFIGVGTSGTLMGCLEYFQLHHPKTKIIAVDAEGSVSFGSLPKTRKIPGLGTSKKPPILDINQVKHIVHISEADTIAACQELLTKSGLFVGGSTGTVVAAIKSYRQQFKNDDIIVGISPDFGNAYINTIYNKSWVKANIQ